MIPNREEIEKRMDEWMNSDESKIYFDNIIKERKIKQSRYARFEEWLKHNDFDKLLYRLILEHNEEYRSKCYHNGIMPYPNNKLQFLIDYVIDNCAPIIVPLIDTDDEVWFFKGYYFQNMCGQGVITKIFNKEDLKLLLVI